ncbi:MAG: pectate lyase [Bacteroidales bacterium]|nr:pectate lyase [Bacteroidales bacterium]
MIKRLYMIAAAMTLCACACACDGEKPADPAAPDVPAGLTLKNATESSLAIQWNAVADATGYDWKLLKGSNEAKSGSVTTRSVIISGLEEGTAYRFAVRSTADGLSSAFSDFLDVSTTGGEEPTPTPEPGKDLTRYYADFLIPSAEEDGSARAFPGAEGGGMFTTGGREGKVYHVTSLEDNASVSGTLRNAVEKGDRPLTVVFDVAGIIPLTKQLNIKKGDITIAGQTAPGDGICLKNYTFRISASNVVVRFIRCRMGDEAKTEDDAIQIMDHTDDKYSNIVIDHCSVSWSTDECASFYGMKDFTFSWNIVSESLRVSIHEKGTHGYGGIWGGNNATYHHNLLAHHDSRNPRIDHDYVSTQKGPLSMVNNVIYNWRGNTCYGGESANNSGTYRTYNLINCYYKPGPATPSNHIWFLDPMTSCSNCTGAMGTSTVVPGHFYMDGNYMYGNSGLTSDNWSGTTASASLVSTIRESKPFASGAVSLHPATSAFNAVLNHAGASLNRDSIDKRVADEVKQGTATYKGSKSGIAGLIDTQSDVGGWPEYSATAEQLGKNTDSDGDGMPDWFEDQFGLDKNDSSDGNAKGFDKNGRYTNLEMYLHYLVREIIAAQNSGSEYKTL